MTTQASKLQKCPSCGFKNTGGLNAGRCVSCGARISALISETPVEEAGGSRRRAGFSFLWFFISLITIGLLTGAVMIGLPRVVPVFDFEGYAGMMMTIPIWAVGGAVIGSISPPRTFSEPVVAAFFVAVPTAILLFQQQTVKTMPLFLYVLFSALGLLFTLVGTYAGERILRGSEASAN